MNVEVCLCFLAMSLSLFLSVHFCVFAFPRTFRITQTIMLSQSKRIFSGPVGFLFHLVAHLSLLSLLLWIHSLIESFWLKSMEIDFGICSVGQASSPQRIVVKNISQKARRFDIKADFSSSVLVYSSPSIFFQLEGVQVDSAKPVKPKGLSCDSLAVSILCSLRCISFLLRGKPSRRNWAIGTKVENLDSQRQTWERASYSFTTWRITQTSLW